MKRINITLRFMRFWAVVFIIMALTGTGSTATTSYNWSFTPPIINNESWVFSKGNITCGMCATPTVIAGNNSADGAPPGSLFANLTVTPIFNKKRGFVETSWRSPNFSWINGTPASARLNFSLRNASSAGSSVTGTFNVALIKPVGRTLIFSTTTIDASGAWLNFSNLSVSPSDFSQSGNYSILLNATLDVTTDNNVGFLEVRWDNPNITLVTSPPNITSWGNNYTNNATLLFDVLLSTSVKFNATPNQTITLWRWFLNDINQGNNYDNFSNHFASEGIYTIKVNASNANGISNTVVWNVSVSALPGAPAIIGFAPVIAGGGGGGCSVSSTEPIANIELQEMRDEFLSAGVPVTFRFTTTELVVSELVITSNISAGTTCAKVEQLKDTSKLVTSPPPGSIYKNVNIWLGTSGFATPENIKEAIVRFRVPNPWLADRDINPLVLYQWYDNKWNVLATKQIEKDANYTYYEAGTNRFSPFAVGAKAIPAATPTVAISPTPTVTVLPPTAVPGIPAWVYGIIALLAALGIAAYYLFALRKKPG